MRGGIKISGEVVEEKGNDINAQTRLIYRFRSFSRAELKFHTTRDNAVALPYTEKRINFRLIDDDITCFSLEERAFAQETERQSSIKGN